jgi:outer membrane receptor protein involved in Fe transport
MVPELSVTIGAGYEFRRGSAELDVRWVGEQFLVGDEGNDAPFEKLSSYALLDVRVEHRVGRVTAFLALSNLLNRNYVSFGIISPNVRGEEDVVERFLTPGLPRTLSIGLRVRASG